MLDSHHSIWGLWHILTSACPGKQLLCPEAGRECCVLGLAALPSLPSIVWVFPKPEPGLWRLSPIPGVGEGLGEGFDGNGVDVSSVGLLTL